jgi:branched-chain amino acid transport system permease protein
MTFPIFLQHVANGIALGGMYALLAVGYNMVYGILRLTNFAHGDVFMMSAYIAFYTWLVLGIPWWLAFPLTMVLGALLGAVIERVAYRPLRDAPRISSMLAAIGVSFLLENVGFVVFGGRPKAFQRPPFLDRVYTFGSVSVPALTFVGILASVFFLLLMSYIIYRSKPGLAMRALAQDFETARLMGINIGTMISLTFMLGSGLAAAGAIIWSLKYPQLLPLMGAMPGLKAFIGAVLGGIGSIPGAMLGAFLLGLSEIMLVAFLPNLTGYRDVFAFSILIAVLLFKPRGLLQGKEVPKV